MEERLATDASMIADDGHPVAAPRRSMCGLQSGHARADDNDTCLGRSHLHGLPVMLISTAHTGVVIAGQTRAIDDAAPTGIAGDTIADVGLAALLTLFGKCGVCDERAPQKIPDRRCRRTARFRIHSGP